MRYWREPRDRRSRLPRRLSVREACESIEPALSVVERDVARTQHFASQSAELSRLIHNRMRVRPIPKLRKGWGRASSKLFSVLLQHRRSFHTLSRDAIRVRAAFQQM